MTVMMGALLQSSGGQLCTCYLLKGTLTSESPGLRAELGTEDLSSTCSGPALGGEGDTGHQVSAPGKHVPVGKTGSHNKNMTPEVTRAGPGRQGDPTEHAASAPAASLPSYAKVKANHSNTTAPDAHTAEGRASPSLGGDGADSRRERRVGGGGKK